MTTRRDFLKLAAAMGISPAMLKQLMFPRPLASTLDGAGKGKNVVILMLDALRPDYTQAYNQQGAESPFFAELAKRSTVFERACSTSTWTAPACASLFTGHYPPQHGIIEGLQAHGRRAEQDVDQVMVNSFAPDMVLLTEYLKEAGYTTFGLSTNPNVGPEIGFSRGFDRLINMDNATADEVLAETNDWKDELESEEQPYFLYLHFMDPHMPYHDRKPWFNADVAATSAIDEAKERYRSEISYLDQQLAKLFEHWQWDDDTIVILVSDHGEELGDHGKIGHRFQMHIELNRIFMMVSGGGLGEAKRVNELVGLHDLMPTLMQYLGLGAPIEGSGLSLLPHFAAQTDGKTSDPAPELPAELQQRFLLAHRRGIKKNQGDIYAVNWGQYRLLQSSTKLRVIYDLAKDPREKRNVHPRKYAGPFKQMAGELDTLLKKGFTDRAKMRPTQQSQADRDLLEELGYVGEDD
jgi:arylsulfatase A-like enzyme